MSISPAAPAPSEIGAQEVIDLERQYLLPNYARYPLVLDHGDGPWLWDVEGRKYLDFISGIGVNALGHNHPRITEVIREQAGLLIHTSNLYYHRYQGQLAKKLAEISGLQRSFFCNSGTEAIEAAMKMIHSHGRGAATNPNTNKFEIIALENSFHGRTLGSLSITGQSKYRRDFEPLIPGIRFVERNNPDRLRAAFSERTAGVVIEWIQGEGGILPITPEFGQLARELADQYDALLVFDEIQCGVGRPGTYFGYQLAPQPVIPDIMLAAKPLACGLPLGVVVMNERAAAAIRPGMHGTTFGGSALCCRVALEFFDILDGLMPQMRRVGEAFRSRLRELQQRYPFIVEVRGAGLMVGVEIAMPGAPIVAEAMKEGLLLNATHDTVLRFLPPYIITEREVDEAVAILDRVFSRVKF
jgi:predicted acetylornithine/succinylornithine family transaminase